MPQLSAARGLLGVHHPGKVRLLPGVEDEETPGLDWLASATPRPGQAPGRGDDPAWAPSWVFRDYWPDVVGEAIVHVGDAQLPADELANRQRRHPHRSHQWVCMPVLHGTLELAAIALA